MTFAPPSPPIWPGGEPIEHKETAVSPVSPSRKPKPDPGSSKQASTRLPPPSLFQGPPSRNASNISLHLPGASAAAIGLPASASTSATSPLDPLQRVPSRRPPDAKNTDPSPSSAGTKGFHPSSTFPRHPTDVNAKRENDRADALWAEMQNTLAEVELSAANGSHIFGGGHAAALEELRTAQLALAQAWAKSEADEVGSHAARDDAEEGGNPRSAGVASREREGNNGAKQGQPPGSAGKNGAEKARRKTREDEEETENDILLARTRREANDRYFEQVNNAVLDVVNKLDVVAGAMRKVEKESRDIWSEDGDGSESITGSTTGG